MMPADPERKSTASDEWEAWREALAKALQGQYGSAKTWATVSEQARDGWRRDAADIMASLPDVPVDQRVVVAAFHHGAEEALDFAWSAIHVLRFAAEHNEIGGPDDFYNGIVKARVEIDKLRREYQRQWDEAH